MMKKKKMCSPSKKVPFYEAEKLSKEEQNKVKAHKEIQKWDCTEKKNSERHFFRHSS